MTCETWNQVYLRLKALLRQAGIENDAGEAGALFEEAFGANRRDLLLHGGRAADPAATARLFKLADRRAGGYPLQYLLGKWWFMEEQFAVGEGVLVPRPDTEIVVLEAERLVKDYALETAADLCSGSGCIAVSLAKRCGSLQVWALELSADAFPYLERNVRESGAHVTPLRADVLQPDGLPLPDALDLVVSNPPYICSETVGTLGKTVSHEPRMALDGGPDGLRFYRGIAEAWKERLRPGGWLVFEIGFDQAAGVRDILAAHGFTELRCLRDYGGNDRVVCGRRSG